MQQAPSPLSYVRERTRNSVTLDFFPLAQRGENFIRYIVKCAGAVVYSGPLTTVTVTSLEPGRPYNFTIQGVATQTKSTPIETQRPVYGGRCGRQIVGYKKVVTGYNNTTTELPPKDLATFEVITLPGITLDPVNSDPGFVEQTRRLVMDHAPACRDELYLTDVNVLLAGQAGEGKTSLLQTCATALKGSVTPLLIAEILSNTPHVTKHYLAYSLSLWGIPGHIQIRDTYGHAADTYKHDEISLMFDGQLPFGWPLDQPALATIDQRMLRTATFADAIHVLAVIVDAQKCRTASAAQDHLKPLRPFIDGASARGIGIVVIVTKVDEVDFELKADPGKVTASEKVYYVREAIATASRLPMNCIYPIKNYTEELHAHPAINSQALQILHAIQTAADMTYRRVLNSFGNIRHAPIGPSINPIEASKRAMASNSVPPLASAAIPKQPAAPASASNLAAEAVARLQGLPGCTDNLRTDLLAHLSDEQIIRCHTRSVGNDALFLALLQKNLAQQRQ